MKRWFDDFAVDSNIVISSRIRLARNIKKYPFSTKIDDEQAKDMIEEVRKSIQNDRTPLGNQFEFIQLNNTDRKDKLSLMENHIISPGMVDKKETCAVLVKNDESVSIMLNEEDHVRIQAVFSGDNIDKAYDIADKIDNLIEESIEYSFDEDYGYLTSCPTNVGTGIRASYMMHLPAIEKAGQIKNIIQLISKFGITIRGIYGEGTEAIGSIYQISNQVTLGRSEREIIDNLKSVSKQVMEQEKRFRENTLNTNKEEFEDIVYRSYGILKNARKISSIEAMNYLSYIRSGYLTGVLDEQRPKDTIYSIMISIQSGHIEKKIGENKTPIERDVERARYLRQMFNN